MKWAAVLICLALMPAFAAPTKKSSPSSKKPVPSAKSRSRRSTRRAARAKPAPSYQAHPDAERYQQIQQALADRGYFKGEVNGQWSDDSVDALRRFQTDQKLPETDGKLDALSLTALGLGPKHGTAAASGSNGPAKSLPSGASTPDSPALPITPPQQSQH